MAQCLVYCVVQMAKKETKSLGFAVFVLAVEITIIALILGGAWLMNKLLLAPFIVISFRLIRIRIETKFDVWHFASVLVCICVSTLLCWFALYLALPLSISLISSVIVGCFVAVATWKIQQFIDMQKLIESFQGSKEQFIDKCRKAELGERDTILATMYIYEKRKPKEIWLWLCEQRQYEQIEWQSVNQALWRINKKLKNVEDL